MSLQVLVVHLHMDVEVKSHETLPYGASADPAPFAEFATMLFNFFDITLS